MATWNKIALAVCAVLLCAAGALFWFGFSEQRRPVPVAPTQAAEPGSLPLVLQGRSYCSVSVPVLAGVTGEVTAINIEIGQAVAKDERLMTFKLSETDAAMLAARLNKSSAIQPIELELQQQTSRLEQIKRNMAETQQLVSMGMAAPNTLKDLTDQLRLAEEGLTLIQTRLRTARQTASDDLAALEKQLGQKLSFGARPSMAYVLAPQAGTVLSIEPTARMGAQTGGKVCTIGTMDPMVIRGQVHESELSHLQNAQNATIILDDGKGETIEAALSRVSWSALDSNLMAPAYYLFELTVPNPDNKIKEGFKVQVSLPPVAPASPVRAVVQAPVSAPVSAPAPAQAAPSAREK